MLPWVIIVIFFMVFFGLIFYFGQRASNAWKLDQKEGKVRLTEKICRDWTDEVWEDIRKTKPALFKRLQFTNIIFLDQRYGYIPQVPLTPFQKQVLIGANLKTIVIFPHNIELVEKNDVRKMKERFQSVIWHEIGHLVYGYNEDEIRTAAQKGILKISR